jgi:hypothetical protein
VLFAVIQRHKPATRITTGLLMTLLILVLDEDVFDSFFLISWYCRPHETWSETKLDHCGALFPARNCMAPAQWCVCVVLHCQRCFELMLERCPSSRQILMCLPSFCRMLQCC